MKISGINFIKAPILAAGLSLAVVSNAQNLINKESPVDTFEYVNPIYPTGTSSPYVLLNAPSPEVEIAGEKKLATIIVDLSKNVLYKYNEYGHATVAYLVASGKKSTPTHTGIRMVTGIETYPYRTAPSNTKRYKNPRDYGPKALILKKVNPETGELSSTGEFIHGNNKKSSLGKYASKGCIRMDNEVIKEIADYVNKGDIVLIIDGESDNAFDNEWFR